MNAQAYLIREKINFQLETFEKYLKGTKMSFEVDPRHMVRLRDNTNDTNLETILRDFFNLNCTTTKVDIFLRNSSHPNYFDIRFLAVDISADFLFQMLQLFGDGVKILAEIQNAEICIPRIASNFEIETCATPDILVMPTYSGFSPTIAGIIKFPSRWQEYWTRNTPATFSADFSIILCGNLILDQQSVSRVSGQNAVTGKTKPPSDPLLIVKTALEKEIATDLIIVCETGVEVKCHKLFLFAHSEVFQTMLKPDYKEGQTNKIELNDMSEASVKAMLSFLYYWDAEIPEKDGKVAVDLLIAGDKYNIAPLKETMMHLILGKPNDFFNIEVALHMYNWSANLEAFAMVKAKAIQLLKQKRQQLVTLAEYAELFKSGKGQELCTDLLL